MRRIEFESDERLCSAPTARAWTLLWGESRSCTNGVTAPASLTPWRPLSCGQMISEAPKLCSGDVQQVQTLVWLEIHLPAATLCLSTDLKLQACSSKVCIVGKVCIACTHD